MRAKKGSALKKLKKLKTILDESKSIFDNQDYLVCRLSSLLQTEFGDEVINGDGYDETFFRMHHAMTNEQLELFDLIRGCTMNSMHRINEELLLWVKENSTIESADKKSQDVERLNTQLIQLKKHLNLWFDKYEAIFKVNIRRSLIYLADEKGHGTRFPLDLKYSLDNVIAELSGIGKSTSDKEKHQLLINNFKKEIETTISQINVSPNSEKSEFESALNRAIEKMVASVDARNKELEGHTQQVTEMTIRIANAMGIFGDELTQIKRGALLHNIGKIAVSEEILQKDSALTDEESQIMKQHPVYANEILQSVSHLRALVDIPYCHHEKWDGTGYPRKIKGLEIPLAARIFAVADMWEALHADRPYRKGWSQEKTNEYIRKNSGVIFDPKIVDTFLEITG